jgi:hypothetical protein
LSTRGGLDRIDDVNRTLTALTGITATWFTMTLTGNDRTDFRSHAVAASEAMRRTLLGRSSPENSGISYCLERQPSLSRLRTPIKVTAVVCAVLGLSGVAIGGIIGFFLKRHIIADNPSLLAIALCCSVGGILLMFLPTFVERRIVRQHLTRRDDCLGSGSELEAIHVSLEHAPTYGSMKILAEDVGLIYIHPESRYVKIDGLSYEYLIRSKDVVSLSLHSNGKSVLLSYMVGEERLDLAVVPRSLRAELKRQTIGSSPGFFVKMQEALESGAGTV